MAALGSQSIASSYEQLLHVDRDGGGNTTTHVSIKDGDNGTTFGFTIASDALMMTSTNRLEFGDTGTYIHQSADGVLDLVSDTEIEINATTIDMNGALDLSGNAQLSGTVTVGADGSGTDVIFYSGTAGDNFSWDASEEKLTITGTNGQTALDVADGNLVVADNVDIEGDIDVNGTSNLDAVDIDGAVQIDAAFTSGVDGQGYDTKFFGDTASAYMMWDTSADDLVFAGAAGIDLDGDIDVNGTANLDNTDIDGTLAVDGTTISLDATTSLNIDNTNTSNGVTINTATSGGPISIGHTTSETTVNDNLSVTGDMAVDGTANLDNTDIDGTLTQDGGNVVFNEDSADYDFRVESNGNANMLFVDGGSDAVGIGTATPDYLVEIEKANGDHTSTALSITNSQAGGYGSALNFVSQRASGTTRAIAASIRSQGNASWADADNTDSNLFFSTVVDGTLTDRMNISGTAGDVTLTTGHLVIDSDTKGLVLGADQDVTLFADAVGSAYFARGTDVTPVGGDTEGWVKIHIGDNDGSYLTVAGGETGDAELYLIADGGDDGGDEWKFRASAGGDLVTESKASGSWVTLSQTSASSGAKTMAKQPAFMATMSGNQDNFAVGSDVTIVFGGTDRFDQGGDFASNTFTAPASGKYMINYNIIITAADSASSYYSLKIVTSNITYEPTIIDPDYGQDNDYISLSGSQLVDMDTSDTVHLAIRQGSGTQQTDISAASRFSGFLAC